LKVLALEREGLAGPGADDEIERFVEPLAALRHRHRISLVVKRRGAAADAEFEPPVAQEIDDRRLFRDLDRVVERQKRHRRAKPDPGGAL
jgi:hypothetical protein